MISALLSRPMFAAVVVLLAVAGTQTIRLYVAQSQIDRMQLELSACERSVANMRLRRGVEDNTATVPDPAGELQQQWRR